MITRADYMENSSELHHAYYSQFVTDASKRFVLSRIGLDKLLASTDKHLNDIPVERVVGGYWLWDKTPVNIAMAKRAGECVASPTYSCRTCVGKAAARMIIEGYGKAKE